MRSIMNKLLVAAALLGITALSSTALADVWRTCTPTSTATYAGRVHVRCSQSYAGIQYFAVRTTNPEEAARFLSTVNAALLAGSNVSVLYNTTDTSGNAWGCNQSNCRRAKGVSLKR
jgi:hypothetical protein